jgi:hypothetical protein
LVVVEVPSRTVTSLPFFDRAMSVSPEMVKVPLAVAPPVTATVRVVSSVRVSV